MWISCTDFRRGHMSIDNIEYGSYFEYNLMIPYVRYCGNDLYNESWYLRERIIQDHELIFITSGEGFFEIGEKNYHTVPGSTIVIKPGIKHCARSVKLPFGFLCAHFDIFVSGKTAIQLPIPTDPQIFKKLTFTADDHIIADEPGYIENLFRRLYAGINKKDNISQHLSRAYFTELLVEISGQHRRFDDAKRYTENIKLVMAYIKDHFSSKITLKDISDHIHLDASYISSLFKKQTGSTITEYINACRIDHAAKLLIDTDMTMEDIADGAGFYDIHHFSRNFKKMQGVSPSAYRNIKRY
jgi:AraC-like DNA-binding protein